MRKIQVNADDGLYTALLLRARHDGLTLTALVSLLVEQAIPKEEREEAAKLAEPLGQTERDAAAAKAERKTARMLRTQERRERRKHLREVAERALAEERAKYVRPIPPLPNVEPHPAPPIAPLPAAPTTTPESSFIAPPKPPTSIPKGWEPWE